MWSGLLREFRYLLSHKWDLCLVTLAPLFIIVLFSSMFYQGKAEHLPIAIIDQDQSELSRTIEKHLSHHSSLKIALISQNNRNIKEIFEKFHNKIKVNFKNKQVLKKIK